MLVPKYDAPVCVWVRVNAVPEPHLICAAAIRKEEEEEEEEEEEKEEEAEEAAECAIRAEEKKTQHAIFPRAAWRLCKGALAPQPCRCLPSGPYVVRGKL